MSGVSTAQNPPSPGLLEREGERDVSLRLLRHAVVHARYCMNGTALAFEPSVTKKV